MKIAINTRFLLKDRLEGIGRVTYEISKRLVAAHPEDQFLLFFDRPYDPSFIFAENVQAQVIGPPARHPLLWYVWFEWSLARALEKWQPDVFFSPDNYLSLKSNIPTVMVNHDIAHVHYPEQIPPLVEKYYRYFVPRYLKRADQIITVSQFVKEDILKHYPAVEAKKISVAPNASAPGFYPIPEQEKNGIKQKYTQGQDYFFYVGSIHPRKNIKRLIAAFVQFKRKTGSPVKFVLGGRLAWSSTSIREVLQSTALKEDIVLTGFIDTQELPKILASSSALVFTSLFEGFGLPILEAMHAEVPVITSNTSSMPEVAGDAAILVDPYNIEEIADAMIKVLDSATRQTLITAGRQQREKFDWDRSAEIVYQALEKAIKGP